MKFPLYFPMPSPYGIFPPSSYLMIISTCMSIRISRPRALFLGRAKKRGGKQEIKKALRVHVSPKTYLSHSTLTYLTHNFQAFGVS